MTGDCHAGILWEPGGAIPPGDPTTLRELGDDALAPPVEQTRAHAGSAAARRASSGSPRQVNAPATREATGALAA